MDSIAKHFCNTLLHTFESAISAFVIVKANKAGHEEVWNAFTVARGLRKTCYDYLVIWLSWAATKY